MTNVAQDQSVLTLSEAAAEHVRSLLTSEPANAGKFLRVYVEGGGCSGMQYGMIFDEKRDDDIMVDSQGLQVAVDAFSANYLRGSVVDYVDSLTGGGFKIANPNAQHSCGCGKSFEA